MGQVIIRNTNNNKTNKGTTTNNTTTTTTITTTTNKKKKITSPSSSSSSSSSLLLPSTTTMINNPFKKDNRSYLKWFHYVILCLIVLVLYFSGLFLNISDDDNNSSIISISSNNNNNLQQQLHPNINKNENEINNSNKLHLRPAYLTDDGIEDEDDATDDGDDDTETEEGDETINNEEDEVDDEEDGEEDIDESNQEKEGEEENLDEDEEGKEGDNDVTIEDENTAGAADDADGDDVSIRRRTSSSKPQLQQHKIPRNLIFTHYKKLLDILPPTTINVSNNKSLLDKNEIEELALAINVQHSIDIHNRSSSRGLGGIDNVYFFTDKECIESLKRIGHSGLVSYFINETEGMYKADICRGSALYEYGGFYLDVDVGVRHDLWEDLNYETEFVTAKVHQQSNWLNHFFQAIVGSTSSNPVLKRYLELFEFHYNGTNRVKKGPLGVILLKRAWDQVRDASYNNKYYNENGNIEQQDQRQRQQQQQQQVQVQKRPVTELYQELLYNKDLFTNLLPPAPTWGKRRACHFLVAGIANNPNNVELNLTTNGKQEDIDNKHIQKQKQIGLQIPILSRIPGSRMCIDENNNNKDSNKNSNKSNNNIIDIIDSMKWWERV